MCVALPLTAQEGGHDGSHTIPLIGLWVSSIGHPNGLYNSLFGLQMEKTGRPVFAGAERVLGGALGTPQPDSARP